MTQEEELRTLRTRIAELEAERDQMLPIYAAHLEQQRRVAEHRERERLRVATLTEHELHRELRHPDYEYLATYNARKQPGGEPPANEGWEPNAIVLITNGVYGPDAPPRYRNWERRAYRDQLLASQKARLETQMTKTAYARRMSPDEFAELTKDMSPDECEECRVELSIDPLFDMWLRFEQVFADRAIDRLDVSDADAEAAAKKMEGISAGANAFAHLLRHIASVRRLRQISHKVSAIWAAAGTSESMSFPEIHERYAKLPKGEA